MILGNDTCVIDLMPRSCTVISILVRIALDPDRRSYSNHDSYLCILKLIMTDCCRKRDVKNFSSQIA